MSLINYHLTTDSLLTALLNIARPQRRTLPPRVLEDLQNLHSLDLYFKDQKLTPASAIANGDYSLASKTLSVQLLYGIKKSAAETADALRLWTGLLSMGTRSIRFVSTKLAVGIMDELLNLHLEPENSTENPMLVELTISELWRRFLSYSWQDVNVYQRTLMLKKIAEWAVKCRDIFWNDSTVAVYTTCLTDDQDSVRNECLRQIKKLAYELGSQEVNCALAWTPFLKVYAEHDHSPGLVNKKTAIEVLSHLSGSTLSRNWCESLLKSSLASSDPPSVIACVLKLVWDVDAANLFVVLCEVFMPGGTATILGKGLALVKPNHAWEELTTALSVYAMSEAQKEFVLHVLAALAHAVPDSKVYDLINTLLKEEATLKVAAKLLHGINVRVPEIFDDTYFDIVAKLIDLRVEEVGKVIETWTSSDLHNGGLALLENRHENVPFGLAGWVNGSTQFKVAAKSRAILKAVDLEEIFLLFDELVVIAEGLDDSFSGDPREVEVLASSLARVYATLTSSNENAFLVTINGEGFQRYNAAHFSVELEHWLQILYDMEVLTIDESFMESEN